jgi:hypothetical protein
LALFLKAISLMNSSEFQTNTSSQPNREIISEFVKLIRKSIDLGPSSLISHIAKCLRNDPLSLPQSLQEADQLEILAKIRPDNFFVEQFDLPQIFPAFLYFDLFKPLQRPFHPKVEEGISFLRNDKMKIENQVSALRCFKEAAGENSIDGCFFFGVLLHWNNTQLHFSNEEENPDLILLRAIHFGSLDALFFYMQRNQINGHQQVQMFNYKTYLIRHNCDYKSIINSKNRYWIKHLLHSIETYDDEDPYEPSTEFFKSFLEDKLGESEEDDFSVVCPGDYWL